MGLKVIQVMKTLIVVKPCEFNALAEEGPNPLRSQLQSWQSVCRLPGGLFSRHNALRQVELKSTGKPSHTAIAQITASNAANNSYLPLSRMR